MIKNPKKENVLTSLGKLDNPKHNEEKVTKVITELLDLIGKYKTKRCHWEMILKSHNDPREHEFYAIIARLTMLDLMVMDLEHLNWLLGETTELTEQDEELFSSDLQN